MNPRIKKLPKGVQSLICASNQINSYTKAVQELIFNALDADATSIAVRIHIAEGSIQVVDNGCGISKVDFKYIGQNYMTSKLVNISTLKSAPNKYGFQGQSLANLAQISELLKIASRYNQCETTCLKTFENGTAKSTIKCSARPSKGTTIEIKGFLYNLNIQKKSVDLINELQSIKTFLEHISLVHSSISLSLRDDSINKIVYKIHKNRDVYQTLSTLYEIEKSNVKELRVEKNEYKVKAYVGKHGVDANRRFIFLNGKFVHDASPLHRKVNYNFKKHLKEGKKKIIKNVHNDEEILTLANQIPFYFMFITCPYMDYEMTNTVLEFRDWEQINILLDKLVKFCIGDMQHKVAPKNAITGLNEKKQETESTRNHIENIMCKILGNHSKKPDISQMQNGVKGKLIKRKLKPKNKTLGSLRVIDSKQSIDKNKRSKQDKNVIHEQTANKDSILKTPSKPENDFYGKKLLFLTTSNDTHAEQPTKTKIQKKPNHKPAISSKIKTQKQIKRTDHTKRAQSKFCSKKKISLMDKFAMETESVKRRCEVLAQETIKLMEKNCRIPEVHINESFHYTSTNYIQNNKNVKIRKKVNEIVIHEYLPLPPKFNIGNQENDHNKKSFNSNYDLLQTILNSQESRKHKQKRKMNNPNVVSPAMDKPDSCFSTDENFDNIPSLFELTKSNHVGLVGELNDLSQFGALNTDFNVRGPGNRSSLLSVTHINNHIPLVREVVDVSPFQVETLDSNIMPYLGQNSKNGSPFQAATFQSHNHYYNQDLCTERDVQANNLDKNQRNFISTVSRKNLILRSGQHNNYIKSTQKRKRNWGNYKHFQPYEINLNKSTKMLDKETNTIKGIRESYTIEFTPSNKYEYNMKNTNSFSRHNNMIAEGVEAPTPSMSYIFNDSLYDCVSPKDLNTWVSSKNESEKYNHLSYEPIIKNTFTRLNSLYKESNIQESFSHVNWNNHETYIIDKTIENPNEPCWESENDNDTNKINTNVIFGSKLQENIVDRPITNPIDVCETVLSDQELSTNGLRELKSTFNCRYKSCSDFNEMADILHELNGTKNVSELHFSSVHATEKKTNHSPRNHPKSLIQDHFDQISNHFIIPENNIYVEKSPIVIDSISEPHNEKITSNKQNKDATIVDDSDNVSMMNKMGAFNIRNRLCFLPKGMSPSFKECLTKPDLGYDKKEDYYEDKIYGNFIEKIENDAEIFKPRIQEASDLTTKDISKVNNKLNNDKSTLKFNGLSIKNANVLGQVDTKFIAATIKGNDRKSDAEEFLVLFDQHAVHERIRLENNLADYLIGSQWKSVAIDEVSLKISRDDILYLHNYRDKFTQLGLDWTILNSHDISITAIPEAILGKNPRQVDKIIKAVKSLITEEIFIIQTQRGCVSLQPKSIMDLVFSEACRYAIKFGDHLSKSQCDELLKRLSDCKTPFQCAHGRPVMAVIMNMESNNVDYKINYAKLRQFKK